jgi:cell volume regulation protein A
MLGSAALAIILFDSGFHTSLRNYRQVAGPAMTLATLGVAITTVVVALAAHWLLGLSWAVAALMGAILSSTDAAAVFFLLRAGSVTLRDRMRSILEVESGVNDPVAATLVFTLAALLAGQAAPAAASMVMSAVWQASSGLVFGLAGGGLIVLVVNRLRLDPGLYPVAVMSLALAVFALTGMTGGSGYVAVYVAGSIAGNAHLNWAGGLRRFQDGISWLAQIVMFVSLGLIARPEHFPHYLGPSIIISAVLFFVARPLAVFVCLAPFHIGMREKLFIAWVGVRGAVSVLLALIPLLAGAADGEACFVISFMVVMASLALQGWTLRPLARWLGLVVPERAGPVDRSQVDLPGLADRELVAYRLDADCAVAKGRPLPRWARPLLVRRGDTTRAHPTRLLPGDLVYLLVSPSQIPALDRLFGRPQEEGAGGRDFLGDFTVAPDVTLAALRDAYGMPLNGAAGTMTVGALLRDALYDDLEEGDRLRVGPIELIVAEMTDGAIGAIGIALDPVAPPQFGWDRLVDRLRSRLSTYAGRR